MAVQFASAQVTPRALKLSLNDPLTRGRLGIFVATFLAPDGEALAWMHAAPPAPQLARLWETSSRRDSQTPGSGPTACGFQGPAT